MKKYDLIVLGGGSAGMSMVFPAAEKEWNTAILDSGNLGGTCVNTGCIPSKTLISSARAMQSVRDVHHYGVIAEPPQADWKAMVERKNQLVEKLRRQIYEGIEANKNITLYEGKATFTGSQTVEIDGEFLTAEKIVIATGARSAIPPVDGLNHIEYLTSTSAMEITELPDSLLILGGGLIALEFAQLFVRLGVEVTIIQRSSRLAPNLEPEISDKIRSILESEGINVKTNTSISSAESEKDSVYLVDETESGPKRYRADKILVSTGRAPNSDVLGLEKAGVETDKRGYIAVDENFKTSSEGVWAIGDVIGGMMFTHKAWHDGLLLSRHLVKGEAIVSSNRVIPAAVFTEPEIASVGMGEAAAIKEGYEIKIQKLPFSSHGRALAMGKLQGFVKLVLDKSSGRILGGHIIGPEAGELIHELVTAVSFGATVYDLQEMIHVHPTLSEAINKTAWAE